MTSSVPGPGGVGVVNVNRRFHYTFNSATRTAGTITKPEFAFIDDERINFARVYVRKVILPMTFHNVVAGVNDKLFFISRDTSGPSNAIYEFTVPDGLYSSLADVWSATNMNSPFLFPNIAVVVGKFGEGDSSANRRITGHPAIHIWPFTAGDVLGFGGTSHLFGETSAQESTAYSLFGIPKEGYSETQLAATSDHEIQAPRPADLNNGRRTINVECNLSFGHMYSTTRRRMVNVVERVPLSIAQIGQIATYEPDNQSGWLVEGFSTFSLIKFTLTDNLNQEIDLEGQDWSIEMTVEEL